jgi:hypothetical protein
MPLGPRRQARFLAEVVILPKGVEPGRWYDVSQGRRHDDNRPGTVQLELGGRRINVLESCVEFRDRPARVLRRLRAPVAIAASLVPLGLAAFVLSTATRSR